MAQAARRGLLGGCAMVALAGCSSLVNVVRSKDVVGLVHSVDTEPPPFPELAGEVSLLVRDSLPDAYWSSVEVTRPLVRHGAPDVLWEAVRCVHATHSTDEERVCFEHMRDGLGLPPAPALDGLTDPAWQAEQDVTRLLVNLRSLVHATVTYYTVTQVRPLDACHAEILDGLRDGLTKFVQYQKHRHVARERSHPVTAFVMAGGAANGACSAGAAWWLLSRLDACKSEKERQGARCSPEGICDGPPQPRSCLQDHVDMLSGTSTGALITLLVKDYFAAVDPGQAANASRRRALDMLRQAYTCSSNGSLYCITNAGLGDLGVNPDGKATGLVRFTGAAQALNEYVRPSTLASFPEYFTSVVEFTSGRSDHFSSADRLDIPSLRALKQAVLASISEPALSEPVPQVGRLHGQLLDGGVRSGLPLLPTLNRGAERAVLFVNAPFEPAPLAHAAPNAISILWRTLDLFAHQPIIGELHEAEYRLALKREEERQLCVERLQQTERVAGPRAAEAAAQAPAEVVKTTLGRAEDIRLLCENRKVPGEAAVPEVHSHDGSPGLSGVANAYRSSRIFEPHQLPPPLDRLQPAIDWKRLHASFYEFDPETMWQIFAFGAAQAHARCAEINETLGWHLKEPSRDWCGTDDELLSQLESIAAQAAACAQRRQPAKVCGPRDVIVLKRN